MHAASAIKLRRRLSCAALAAALTAATGCSALLDLPSDPVLASGAPPGPDASSSELPGASPTGTNMLPGGAHAEAPEAPPLIEPTVDTSEPAPPSSSVEADSAATPDAGASDVPPASDCTPPPVDIVLIIDNSGSMDVGTQQAEVALPSFALRLEQADVDYRIILISRHRTAARTASTEASTSVCVGPPLSGLAACPAARPVPTARFFQHSTKIDATDSFQRVLEAASTPDGFGLTSVGWLDWLRPGALVEFVEVTDDDSALTPEAFVIGLAELAPDRFSATMNAPGFIFHSVAGLATRATGSGDVYLPGEPLQRARCTRQEGSPNNAGETYQALSQATGGLRLPVCPSSALTARLDAIASDVATRNANTCPAN